MKNHIKIALIVCAISPGFTGCSDFAQGFANGYARVHAQSAYVPAYTESEPEISYQQPYVAPPQQPVQFGSFITPGQAPSSYWYNPNTGFGTVMTPGQQPTFINRY